MHVSIVLYLLLTTTTVANAAPGFSRYDTLYIDGSLTQPNYTQHALLGLIDWCKRSLQHVFQLVLSWKSPPVPALQLNSSTRWDESDTSVPGRSNRTSNACTNPSVRREWRNMTVNQREAWIDAIHCLAGLPGSDQLAPSVMPTDPENANPPVNRSGSWYDDLSYVHMDLNTIIHQTGLFFPWHRYFLWSLEQTLKDQCGYSGALPYWNWTQDAHDFKNATIFDPKTGLGGFGDPENDHVVRDGPFAGLQLAYPSPHTLRREYTPYPFRTLTPPLFTNQSTPAASTFTHEKIDIIRNSFRGDFKAFQTYVEHTQGPHMSVHFILGGDLGGSCPKNAPLECRHDAKWSPNEPMFWLHHGMLDKIWFDWQHAHPANLLAFEAGTIRDLKTWPKYPNGAPPAMTPDFRLPKNGILVGNHTVRDMFDTTSNAPLCYTYF